MEVRRIRSLWITRKSIDSGFHPPELLEAWDEWSIEENWDGWQEACRKALEAVGSDLSTHRYVEIVVRAEDVAAPFEMAEIRGMTVARPEGER